MPYEIPVSIVIATLGGDSLLSVLKKIYAGTKIPFEILICVPKGCNIHREWLFNPRTRIIFADVKGQVAQRAFGLSIAKSEYVLQLDDDIFLELDTLERLFNSFLTLPGRNALSCLFTNKDTGNQLSSYISGPVGVLKSLASSLCYGALWGKSRMGRISRSGIPFSIDPVYTNNTSPVEVDWVPGGCVICRKSDLIYANYFPFCGKAYGEDVIHSILWRKEGVRLWVDANISCKTIICTKSISYKELLAEFKAIKYIASLMGNSKIYCYFWFCVSTIKYLLNKK